MLTCTTCIHEFMNPKHTYMHACMHACMHTYIPTNIHACMHTTCMRASTHAYLHTLTHTFIHTGTSLSSHARTSRCHRSACVSLSLSLLPSLFWPLSFLCVYVHVSLLVFLCVSVAVSCCLLCDIEVVFAPV